MSSSQLAKKSELKVEICAHGRPTTVPLLNMASLHEQLAKLKVDKGGSSETWHGLRVHRRPSIRRAQLLLDSAKRFHNG
ncbi:hypothetical protein MUK42_20872 [Musa troglodytarum]|uniref:Uncharacterized protein n=1 Tax=Musa troglodytarum TaxID=320322 RepID=A0A9E7ENX8_9LILI|nr:hypothetical protein MUK42_20872 [Musa troglodytarum]